jgi:hypothetical protein
MIVTQCYLDAGFKNVIPIDNGMHDLTDRPALLTQGGVEVGLG